MNEIDELYPRYSWVRYCPGDHSNNDIPRPLSVRRSLCAECLNKYGEDSNNWPPWLQFLVKNDAKMRREDRQYSKQYRIE